MSFVPLILVSLEGQWYNRRHGLGKTAADIDPNNRVGQGTSYDAGAVRLLYGTIDAERDGVKVTPRKGD